MGWSLYWSIKRRFISKTTCTKSSCTYLWLYFQTILIQISKINREWLIHSMKFLNLYTCILLAERNIGRKLMIKRVYKIILLIKSSLYKNLVFSWTCNTSGSDVELIYSPWNWKLEPGHIKLHILIIQKLNYNSDKPPNCKTETVFVFWSFWFFT